MAHLNLYFTTSGIPCVHDKQRDPFSAIFSSPSIRTSRRVSCWELPSEYGGLHQLVVDSTRPTDVDVRVEDVILPEVSSESLEIKLICEPDDMIFGLGIYFGNGVSLELAPAEAIRFIEKVMEENPKTLLAALQDMPQEEEPEA